MNLPTHKQCICVSGRYLQLGNRQLHRYLGLVPLKAFHKGIHAGTYLRGTWGTLSSCAQRYFPPLTDSLPNSPSSRSPRKPPAVRIHPAFPPVRT